MAEAQNVLNVVRRWPSTRVQIDERRGAASITVGPRVVARIGLCDPSVSVFAPADTLESLLEIFPLATRQPDGISFRLGGRVSQEVVLAAIERRVTVERYAGQFREQSP